MMGGDGAGRDDDPPDDLGLPPLRPQPQGAGGGDAAPAATTGDSSAALQATTDAWGALVRARAVMATALNTRAQSAVHGGVALPPVAAPARAGDGLSAHVMGAHAAGVAAGTPCLGTRVQVQRAVPAVGGTAGAPCAGAPMCVHTACASMMGLAGMARPPPPAAAPRSPDSAEAAELRLPPTPSIKLPTRRLRTSPRSARTLWAALRAAVLGWTGHRRSKPPWILRQSDAQL